MANKDDIQSDYVEASAFHQLSRLVERDESPQIGPCLDYILSSPIPPPNTVITQATALSSDVIIKTPQTTNRICPSLEEMHPSKVQQSTARKPNSGLRFGFVDVNSRATSPSKPSLKAMHLGTPTKSHGAPLNQISSPIFEFKWNGPDSALSSEAQKIMESVRDEAARIRLKVREERDEQARKDGETNQLYGAGDRKIAKLKGTGKAGRYSNAHIHEFKKMDSIAGHVSTWKNKLKETSSMSLKRSKSKAGLDHPEHSAVQERAGKSLKRDQNHTRLENTGPSKRVKQNYHEDTSAARPSSRDNYPDHKSEISASGLTRSKLAIPSVASTPTKAFLARVASVKQSKSSKIQSFSRLKSTRNVTDPYRPKTERSNKYLSSLPNFESMKSIINKSLPKSSDDPVKSVKSNKVLPLIEEANLNKKLPNIPSTSSEETRCSLVDKRVDLTPVTKSSYELAANSPSPSKVSAPHILHQDLTPLKTPDHVLYPSLAMTGPLTSNPTQPSDFTFRSAKTVKIGPATSGIRNPTIRQVRPSGVATPLAAFSDLPAIPHGMPNKKRRYPGSDDEDIENIEPRTVRVEGEGPNAKKQKSAPRLGTASSSSHISGTKKMAGRDNKVAKTANSRFKGKGVLSLSRLNILARPKERL